MTYYLTPVHKVHDTDTGEIISVEWGMLDGDGEVVSAIVNCPFGLKTLGESDTQFGVSVPADPQGILDGVLGPWSPLDGWTATTLEEIQALGGE